MHKQRTWVELRPAPDPPKPPPGHDTIAHFREIGKAAGPHVLDTMIGVYTEMLQQGDAERIMLHGGEIKNGAYVKIAGAMAGYQKLLPYLVPRKLEVSGSVKMQPYEERLAEMQRSSDMLLGVAVNGGGNGSDR